MVAATVSVMTCGARGRCTSACARGPERSTPAVARRYHEPWPTNDARRPGVRRRPRELCCHPRTGRAGPPPRAHGHTIDITTIGGRSGQPRRKEIVCHAIAGCLSIGGTPRPRERDWLRNLAADPQPTFHLKETVRADLPAAARVIDDEQERRAILAEIARLWRRDDLAAMVRESPPIAVTIAAAVP